jgi:hypothetical protein
MTCVSDVDTMANSTVIFAIAGPSRLPLTRVTFNCQESPETGPETTVGALPVKKVPIVLSVVTTLACGQSYADPLASDATACDAAKVDARNVVLWVLCHNQADARLDKNEPPYLIEVWLGYRSGRLYLAEQFHDGKISEEDFRTKLALIGKEAFDEAERRRRAHEGH